MNDEIRHCEERSNLCFISKPVIRNTGCFDPRSDVLVKQIPTNFLFPPPALRQLSDLCNKFW